MEKTILIEGMSCGHCVKAVKEALKELDGVKSVVVDLEGKKAVVEGDNLDDNKIKEAIDEAGYDIIEIK
ncbi:heavy-metal-associated domain-containing protein [Anaerosalibacter bizertensis]|uniref:Copper ion binding protein n=1 Tax=Anaerosalibacter bizertensis TaxID=932217 RepID=A0A844FHM1_9FIRM|nr:copper ion binding protein [Anaerosalibacter bizertensis]MBU5294623.1 copper ion binding protein [Anaerosalibacter bizertensis]MCB5558950.1 copper ion binding protein [Anaerosalibacter bizertensis]MCG4565231.1 copper ion binding protein [Anaerosalibacter bizertensis]MCG4581977.1 copper ion binding protein [Anaerosalibacter bizertensis]MCG4584634.1 copper ion binding protein [Anaerosalibacter bizertensis]